MRARYLLVAGLLLAGCVRQTLAIRSEPPGARAFVNGRFVGETPVNVPFDWYTNYLIHVDKAGYLPVDDRQAVRAPWYMWIPLDVVTEALPWRVKDERRFTYDLAAAEDGVGPPLWPIITPAVTSSTDAAATTTTTKGASTP